MKNTQSGRSMVEMLGVLAIIGVLSAGALKGYSAAMFRHKTNQTIDIFSQVLQRFAELENQNLGNNIDITGATGLTKYHLIENCIQTENDECQLPIGVLYPFMEYHPDIRGFLGEIEVDFTDSKSCIAFASAGWGNAVPQEWFSDYGRIYIGSAGSGGGTTIYGMDGEDFISQTNMSDIVTGCQICDERECSVGIVIRGYL